MPVGAGTTYCIFFAAFVFATACGVVGLISPCAGSVKGLEVPLEQMICFGIMSEKFGAIDASSF